MDVFSDDKRVFHRVTIWVNLCVPVTEYSEMSFFSYTLSLNSKNTFQLFIELFYFIIFVPEGQCINLYISAHKPVSF